MELLPVVMSIPGVSIFLSAKLNQDILEKHFGIIRQKGSSNDNPTVSEALKSTQTVRVINSIWMDDIVGNCRGQKVKFDVDPNAPLNKRTKKKSS